MPKKSSQSFESDTFSVHAADIESATEQDSDPDSAYYTTYPNRWARIKHPLREYVAEFLGTAVLVIFGTGVDCQVVLSTNPQVASSPRGIYLSISFGWGIATALGVWCAGGISGGHINPAVTLALAVFRDFPWRKVPGYIFSQILGGCIGACLVYATYFHAIDIFEGGRGIRTPGTASLFITFPLDYMTSVSCFFDEFFGTALLLIVILAITDKRNSPPPAGLVPLVLFFLVTGEGASLGMQTAYAINPARDLGPRIMTYMVGYGTEVWNYRNQYWLWVPFLGPIAGGLVGTAFYDAFLYTGSDSIFNRPNKQARLHHARSTKQATEKVPAGVHE